MRPADRSLNTTALDYLSNDLSDRKLDLGKIGTLKRISGKRSCQETVKDKLVFKTSVNRGTRLGGSPRVYMPSRRVLASK